MIKIDGHPIEIGNFPDGTLLLKYAPSLRQIEENARLYWQYENDREFLALIYLVNHLRERGVIDIYLGMPYIPNARMDRTKNKEDVFTLKYFAEILNSLNFRQVVVLDPHSDVSSALIKNLTVESPKMYVEQAIAKIIPDLRKIHEPDAELMMFYPDNGAAKRYSDMVKLPYAFGIKRRNWETGVIEGLDVSGAVDQIAGKDILIVDDICSRGGTFYHSAKKLKELGANDIYLYVSHCENTILEGDLLKGDLVKRVYTTDSIFTKSHEKIEVLK